MVKDDVFDESELSEFNAAIATLMRIHEIKKWLAVATEQDNLYFYYKHIKMFYKELAPMFKTTKEKDAGKDIQTEKELQEAFWEAARILNFNTTDEKEKKEILIFLEEWELELRQIEQDKGMNLPKKPDARWSLSRR